MNVSDIVSPSYILAFLNFSTMHQVVAARPQERILLAIKVKKGTPVAYVPRALGGAMDYYNLFREAQIDLPFLFGFMLPRNGALRFVSRTLLNGQRAVITEYVAPNEAKQVAAPPVRALISFPKNS